jgi:hypothetical protein
MYASFEAMLSESHDTTNRFSFDGDIPDSEIAGRDVRRYSGEVPSFKTSLFALKVPKADSRGSCGGSQSESEWLT